MLQKFPPNNFFPIPHPKHQQAWICLPHRDGEIKVQIIWHCMRDWALSVWWMALSISEGSDSLLYSCGEQGTNLWIHTSSSSSDICGFLHAAFLPSTGSERACSLLWTSPPGRGSRWVCCLLVKAVAFLGAVGAVWDRKVVAASPSATWPVAAMLNAKAGRSSVVALRSGLTPRLESSDELRNIKGSFCLWSEAGRFLFGSFFKASI